MWLSGLSGSMDSEKKYHFINHLGVYMMVTLAGIHDLSNENSGSVAVIPRQ